MPSSEAPDAGTVLRRYEEIRPRLPAAHFAERPREIADLSAIIDEFDVFVLDGYGVLNTGAEAIPGAVERVAALRAAGRRLFVLTNAASYPAAATAARYRRLGFDFAPEEIVSSRDALARALTGRSEHLWGLAARHDVANDDLDVEGVILADDPAPYEAAEGFLLLSTAEWNAARQKRLLAALAARPRPVLVGNPDLVSPREGWLALEPGWYAHEIADRSGIEPEFFGKPYANAFAAVAERLGENVPPERIAMVGDSPHTDILGGAAMGWRTVLVTGHGLLKGWSRMEIESATDIRPDFYATTT